MTAVVKHELGIYNWMYGHTCLILIETIHSRCKTEYSRECKTWWSVLLTNLSYSSLYLQDGPVGL